MSIFSSSRRIRSWSFVARLVLVGAWAGCVAAACDPVDSNDRTREEAKRVFGTTDGGGSGTPSSDAWTIVIVAIRGEQAEAGAAEALHTVQTRGGLPSAYLERRGEAIVVAYGSYPSADDPAGVADLERIRSTEIRNQDGTLGRPFAGAMLTPPIVQGSIPEYDLRRARELHGGTYRYTLQVGVYSREDRPPTERELAEFRATAERAVLDLRRAGERAFYFHGPTRSMITIGLFTDETLAGLEMNQAKERHPYNLQNGRGVRQRMPEFPENDPRGWRVQASFPVRIPGS